MIDFMVIGLARSCTSWAANWLTTDTTLCLHDPLFKYHYAELDAIPSSKSLGISCTGIHEFHDWLRGHHARKVIVHRPIDEIKQSLISMGFEDNVFDYLERGERSLKSMDGMHINVEDFFNNPKEIYEFLLKKSFDQERHELLCKMNIQADLSLIKVDPAVTKQLISEMRGH